MDNLSRAAEPPSRRTSEGIKINPYAPPHLHAEQPLPQSWARRNIVALVIGGVLLLVVLLTGCIGGAIYFGISALGSHSSVQAAVQQAVADPRVVERLGSPIEKGWFVTGNISVVNGQQTANMQVTLKGPRGEGRLLYTGTKGVGANWVFTIFTLETDGQPDLDLLTPSGVLVPATPAAIPPPGPAPRPAPDSGDR